MQIDSMRAFLLFSRYMNVSRVAKILNISQPTLSYRISQLEKELGCDLYTRGPNPYLTESGKQFVHYAELIVSSYDEMVEACRSELKSGRKELRFERPITYQVVGEDIKEFFAKFTAATNVNVRMVETEMALFDVIEEGKSDIAFMWAHPEVVKEEVGCVGYIPVPCVKHPQPRMYMRKDNPLAAKEVLAYGDLTESSIVLPLSIRFSAFEKPIRDGMRLSGERLHVVHKYGDYRQIEQNLGRNELAFSLDDLGEDEELERKYGLVSRELTGEAFAVEAYLIYNLGSDNPSLNALLEYIEDTLLA